MDLGLSVPQNSSLSGGLRGACMFLKHADYLVAEVGQDAVL